jgi:hypothetical protein
MKAAIDSDVLIHFLQGIDAAAAESDRAFRGDSQEGR